jgi:hypothetical protein
MTIHRIRLSKMQKLINVLALASFAVSGAVVGSGVYVYLNRASIIDGVKSQIMGSVLGGSGLPDGLGGEELPVGTPDLAPPVDSAGGFGLPVPSSPL